MPPRRLGRMEAPPDRRRPTDETMQKMNKMSDDDHTMTKIRHSLWYTQRSIVPRQHAYGHWSWDHDHDESDDLLPQDQDHVVSSVDNETKIVAGQGITSKSKSKSKYMLIFFKLHQRAINFTSTSCQSTLRQQHMHRPWR